MPNATIRVQFVNPPKPGKKQGSIKTFDGQFYGVDPTQLGQFREGGSYAIEYDTHVYQGKEYKTFRRMDANSPQPGVPQAQAFSTPVEIFAREIISSAIHGIGTLPDTEILTTWCKSLNTAFNNVFGDKKPETDLDNPEF